MLQGHKQKAPVIKEKQNNNKVDQCKEVSREHDPRLKFK